MTSTIKLGTLMAMLLAAGCSSNNAATASDAGTDEEAGLDGGDDAEDAATVPYPPGPYGITLNKVLDPSLTWQGYAPGATTASIIKITDLYDPDGSKGINAIVIDNAGQWCVACQGISKEIPTWLSPQGDNWGKLGVKILNLIIQNNDYEPATITTAEQWRTAYSLTAIYVVADPNTTFPASQLPHDFLVNPRTMKIVVNMDGDTSLNNDGSDPAVTTLAKKNAAAVGDGG